MSKSNTTSSSSMVASSTPASLTEHLSALLDDEVGAFEQRRVLDELKSNDDLCQKLSSYTLIGEAMRSGDATITAGASFLAGIHEKIESEAEYDHIQLEDAHATNRSSSSWLRPVGGFALAASVAAIGVIGFYNYQQIDRPGIVTTSVKSEIKPQKSSLTVAEMNSATVVSADSVIAVDGETAVIPSLYRQADARTRSLLKRYVDSHMQHASTATFVPSVRVIAYAD